MDQDLLEQLTKLSDGDLSELDSFTANQPQMPAYMKEQLITRMEQPDIQTASSVKKLSKKLELFLFGCKVTAAVAASLLIMITSSLTGNPTAETTPVSVPSVKQEKEFDVTGQIIKQLNSSSSGVTSWLQSISETITGNAKKEK